jgi:hypothetical protein
LVDMPPCCSEIQAATTTPVGDTATCVSASITLSVETEITSGEMGPPELPELLDELELLEELELLDELEAPPPAPPPPEVVELAVVSLPPQPAKEPPASAASAATRDVEERTWRRAKECML